METLLTTFGIVIVMLCSGCIEQSTSRSDVPLTRAAAMKVLDIPLPASAHNVYYFDHVGGLQELERYIRFDLKREELASAVDALVASNNKMFGRSLPYRKASLAAADLPAPDAKFLPMTWWDPQTVTNGYYRGHNDAYALRALVDHSRPRVYVYQSD